jgi:hypothetical protein
MKFPRLGVASWKTAVLAGQAVSWFGLICDELGPWVWDAKHTAWSLVFIPIFYGTGAYWVLGAEMFGLVKGNNARRSPADVVADVWGRMLVWFLSASAVILLRVALLGWKK